MDLSAILNHPTAAGSASRAASYNAGAADPAAATSRPVSPSSSRPSSRSSHPSRDAPPPLTPILPIFDDTEAASILASLSGFSTSSAPRRSSRPSSRLSSKSHRQSSVQPPPSPTGPVDDATTRAIREAQNPYNIRRRGSKQAMSASPAPASSPAPTAEAPPAPVVPPQAAPKKRPTPKNASKAGVGVKKPKPKKRKLEDADSAGTGKKKGTNKKSQSGTPMAGATPEPDAMDMDDDDDESVEDENAVYCICRKPDNHTWMIGCDGGCDDWYHGKCVNMRQEDEQLLDKFICPICAEKQPGKVTTWKPMCRLDGCRNPARLKKGAESKYCSDACGKEFMKRMVQQSRTLAHGRGKKPKPDEADVGPLGGPISAPQLKALVSATTDAPSFRNLGDLAPLTPPDSNAGQSPVQTEMDVDEPAVAPAYEPYELARLDEISARKAELYGRRMMLKARHKFVMMARDRAQRLKHTTKDLCGYDPRLALDERTFHTWAQSPAGREVLDKDALSDPPADTCASADAPSTCMRRKCKKHAEWQKISLVDVRFDEAEVGDEMRQIDREETDLKQSGTVRARKRKAGVDGDEGHVEVLDEGHVEVVNEIMDEIMGS